MCDKCSCYVAQPGADLSIFSVCLLSAGRTGVCDVLVPQRAFVLDLVREVVIVGW